MVSSSDLVINHGTNLDINIKGNLYNLQESGARLRFQPYHENRCTMSVRRSLTSISAAGNINVSSEEGVIYTASIVLPFKK